MGAESLAEEPDWPILVGVTFHSKLGRFSLISNSIDLSSWPTVIPPIQPRVLSPFGKPFGRDTGGCDLTKVPNFGSVCPSESGSD